MSKSAEYGDYYWRVKTPSGSICLFADLVRVECGALFCESFRSNGKLRCAVIYASGTWLSVESIAMGDGIAVQVESRWRRKGVTRA